MTLKIKIHVIPISEACFEKFFDSHVYNYTDKLKMIKWNRFDTKNERVNELFSPAESASQVL